jgi:glycosyltransferase involved in cell wall biosynthesis
MEIPVGSQGRIAEQDAPSFQKGSERILPPEKHGLVSIIIPSKNSLLTLPLVLESISAQDYDNFEVLIINRGPVEELSNLCSSYAFCRIYQLSTERTRAVNFGAAESKGEFIYYLGSDYILDRHLLREAVQKIRETEADALIIPNTIDESQGFWAKVKNLEKTAFLGDKRLEASRFFKKDVFMALGGYDTNLVAYEEHDLHDRLVKAGYNVARLSTSFETILGEPATLSQYIRKSYYYGTTIGRYVSKQPSDSINHLLPFRFLFAKNRQAFARSPWLTLGFLMFQTTRYLSGILGLITNSMTRFMATHKVRNNRVSKISELSVTSS